MKIKITDKTININIKLLTEAIKTVNFDLKRKIEFLDVDEYEIEIIMNVKICKSLLVELGGFITKNEDVKILMEKLFDEKVTLEELDEIDKKLVKEYDKMIENQL